MIDGYHQLSLLWAQLSAKQLIMIEYCGDIKL